jgi:hypothetical protein
MPYLMSMRSRSLWIWYAVPGLILLYFALTYEGVEPLVNSRLPMVHQWPTIRIEAAFAVVIWLGLLWCDRYAVGRVTALAVSSCCLAMTALAVTGAWIEFANRRADADAWRLPPKLQAFLDRHDAFDPLNVGFWVVIAPFSVVALLGLLWTFRKRLSLTSQGLRP